MKLNRKTAGDGAPLVLLHGGMGSINHWHHNFEALAEHYTVHALDMPGYGESPTVPKETPADAYVGLVVDALNDVVPSGSFRLAGFSFGSCIAALCAARMGKRVHKYSGMGAGGFHRHAPRLAMKKIPSPSAGDAVMREVLAHNLRVMMIADPAKVTAAAVDLHHENVKRTRYDGRHVSLTEGLMPGCLREMTCPAQLIWGDNDVMCVPGLEPRIAQVRATRPDVRIDIVAGAGHWVQYEAADAVNRLLLDFLRD